MSSNDYIRIKKGKGKFIVKHQDWELGTTIKKIGEFETLEDAVRGANKYRMEQMFDVEYGLEITL